MPVVHLLCVSVTVATSVKLNSWSQMFLFSSTKLLLLTICITCGHFVNSSRFKSRDEAKSGPVDGIFFSERSAAISAPKKPAAPTRTRWPPFMDTWTTEPVQRSPTYASSSKSEVSTQPGHPPLATDIKCSTRGHSHQLFTAVISRPFGFHNVPLFEDAVNTGNSLTSEECQMRRSGDADGTFLMKIIDFSKCGVTTQKAPDGKEWLSVSIVFPYVGGLRTSSDEHVMIMCKPQDRVATKSHVLDYRPNM